MKFTKLKRYTECLICGADISRLRRGTKVCSPEHAKVLRRRYLNEYYGERKKMYADNVKRWRKNNPEKYKEAMKRAYAHRKELYAKLKTEAENPVAQEPPAPICLPPESRLNE